MCGLCPCKFDCSYLTNYVYDIILPKTLCGPIRTSVYVPTPLLTLFYLGSGKTLLPGGVPLWPPLIFCFIGHQKVVLTPKTCSQIKFLIFRHPFTPLFQHSRESVPLFMSINVDQYLHIETLKIGKTPKGK